MDERVVERSARFLPLLGTGVVRFVLELRLGWETVLVIRILLACAGALPESEVLPVLGDFFLVLNRTVLVLNLILLVLVVLLLLPTDYSL